LNKPARVMKRMNFKILILFCVGMISLSSCASMFNSSKQKVTVLKDKDAEIHITGGESKYIAKKDKYKVSREGDGLQVELKKSGHKSVHTVEVLRRSSPLRQLNWLSAGYGFFLDIAPKAFRYNRLWDYSSVEFRKWPEKSAESKDIYLRSVAVQVDAENLRQNYYRNLKDKRATKMTSLDQGEEGINLENTDFKFLLNDILAEQGYIDTTSKALKSSYLNNLYVEATVSAIEYDWYGSAYKYGGKSIYRFKLYIDWVIKDYYGEETYKMSTKTSSGLFSYGIHKKQAIDFGIQDALEYGLIDFLDDAEVQMQLNDKSELEKENSLTLLEIPSSSSYVSTLGESIKSSATVLRKDEGHGSGFS